MVILVFKFFHKVFKTPKKQFCFASKKVLRVEKKIRRPSEKYLNKEKLKFYSPEGLKDAEEVKEIERI